ncbi:ABC transporter permease [Candidatus Pacearchaeota archaeon]|nr:ABC transporter permease [Candidatus Pacearchaeota archaeon]
MNTNIFKNILRRSETSITLAAILLFILFSIASPSFLTAYNIFNVSRNISLYVFIAIAQALAIVGGGMNLSVGAIGGLGVVATGYFIDVMGFPPWIAVLIALIVGITAGAFNGVIITKVGINSFVVTLATLFVFTGIVYGITKGYPYINIPKSFTIVGRKGVFNLPYVFWLVVGALGFLYYMFKFMRFGKRLLATGGSIEATRLSGVNTDRIIIMSNILSGLFAAIAGVLWVSRMGSAQPSTGQNWLIISFAVAIIGGTALSGGFISALGLLMGGVIIVLIRNGLILLEVNVYFEQTFLGFIILLAVSIDRIRTIFNLRVGI